MAVSSNATLQRLAVAKAKIHRAKAQIENFDREVETFLNTNGYDVTSELNLDKSERVWRFRLRTRDTTALSVLAGEIGHNLRSSLDNLVCEIAEQYSGRRDRTYFPFGKSVDILETEITRKTKDLPSDAVDMIRQLRPYKSGNDLLWAIHELNRDDKHPGLHPIATGQGMILSKIAVYDGPLFIIGSRHGQHLVVEGYKPKFFAVETMSEDYEFATSAPHAKVYIEGKPTFYVAFREIEVLKGKSAVTSLHQMRDLVEGIFLTFEKRFFV